MPRVAGFGGRRFNRILAAGLALLVLVWCVKVRAWASPIVLPIALALWAYLLSALLLLEWAILRVRRRGVPALPFGPASWSVTGTNAGGTKSVAIQLHDSISQSTTGLCSCYAFRRKIGSKAANLVAGELNQVLRNN